MFHIDTTEVTEHHNAPLKNLRLFSSPGRRLFRFILQPFPYRRRDSRHEQFYSTSVLGGICYTQGGLAATFDLAAFGLYMIAPVKKSVNHSKTLTSMREVQRSLARTTRQ